MKRDSFIFYRSFMEALADLNDAQYARVFRAISKFALDGKEVKLVGVEKVIFQLVKPQLVANQKRYDNGCKGGRPKTKPSENQDETTLEPNENDNVNENDLKVSKQVKKENNFKCADYEEVMTDFGVSDVLKPVLFEFIKHCQINGRKLTNDKLESVIIELDKQDTEAEKITLVNNAINGGYFDIRRG